jgi:hypothetical protein
MQTNIQTMTTDDGTTEIRWGRGDSDGAISGYIIVHPDGTAVFPHGDGAVIFLAGSDTRVVAGEDSYGGPPDPNETVLWHVNELED